MAPHDDAARARVVPLNTGRQPAACTSNPARQAARTTRMHEPDGSTGRKRLVSCYWSLALREGAGQWSVCAWEFEMHGSVSEEARHHERRANPVQSTRMQQASRVLHP